MCCLGDFVCRGGWVGVGGWVCMVDGCVWGE